MKYDKEMIIRLESIEDKHILENFFKRNFDNEYLVVTNKNKIYNFEHEYFSNHYLKNNKIVSCFQTNTAQDIINFYEYGIVPGHISYAFPLTGLLKDNNAVEDIVRTFTGIKTFTIEKDTQYIVISKYKVTQLKSSDTGKFFEVPAFHIHIGNELSYNRIASIFHKNSKSIEDGFYIKANKKYYRIILNTSVVNKNYFSSVKLEEIKNPQFELRNALDKYNDVIFRKSSTGFARIPDTRIIKFFGSDDYFLVDDVEPIDMVQLLI